MKRILDSEDVSDSCHGQKRIKTEHGRLSPRSTNHDDRPVKRRLQYDKLNHRHIRLLKVHLNDSKQLCGSFVQTDLDDLNYEYTAISYCWGDSDNGGRLWFEGGFCLNLGEAANDILRKWAADSPEEYVWLDFACIDQANILERGQQVNVMLEIYAKSESVMISLPTKYHGWGVHAAKYVDFVSALLRRTPTTGSLVGKSAREAVLKTEMIRWCSKNAGLNALARIIDSSPYLSRTWIIQEIVSSSFAEIICDGASMRWKDFAQAVLLSRKFDLYNRFKGQRKKPLSERFTININAISYIERLRRRRRDGQTMRIRDLLLEARYAQASQPLDKVFALRGLATDIDTDEFAVDYSLSVREVYTRASRLLLVEKGAHQALSMAGIWRHQDGDDLPSWAVDFRPVQLEPIIKGLDESAGAENGRTVIEVLEGDLIQIRGRIIGTVASTIGPGEPVDRALMAGKIKKWYRQAMTPNTGASQSSSGSINSQVESQPPGAKSKQILTTSSIADESTLFSTSVAQLKNLTHDHNPGKTHISQTACLHHLANFICDADISRKLFVTDSDRIGLAPSIVRDGDLLVAFNGYRSPFVVRRDAPLQENSDDDAEEETRRTTRFTLVGQVFVPGVPGGESTNTAGEEEDIVLS